MGFLASLLPATLMLEEALGLGALFSVRGEVAPPADVVVIGISRESAQALGQTTELDTWPRELHAQLVERLTAAGVTAVAFDLMFHEPRARAGDALFAASIGRAGRVLLLEETGDSDALSLDGGSTAWLEQRTPPLASLKETALGSAPFILPTVPLRVGQAWTFDRVTDDTPSLPVLALQAHLLPYYEEFVRLLERARPGATRAWPQTRAAVEAQGNLELLMGVIRGTLQSDSALRAAAVAELAHRRPADATDLALTVLLDLYAGSNSRYLNFYGPARAIQTVPYDRALMGSSEIDLAGKVAFVGMSEPRQPRQQDDFYSVFSAEHRHQSERCRGRCDRCRQPPRATHAAAVAAAVSRRARRAARRRVRFGHRPAQHGARGRCRPGRRCALLHGGGVAVHELRGLVAAGRTAAPAVARCSWSGSLVELSRGCRAARARANRTRVLRAEVALQDG